MDRGRDHALANGPFDEPDDSARPLVHFVPAEAGINHRLANGLELERPEIPGHRIAVKLAERPDRLADASRLRRRLPALDVVTIGECEVEPEQLVHREIRPGSGDRSREASAVGNPLDDESIVLGPAPRRAEPAEIEILPVQAHNGLARRLVETVRRRAECAIGHGANLQIR